MHDGNDDKLTDLLLEVHSKITGKLVIVGDFNLPHLCWDENGPHLIENDNLSNAFVECYRNTYMYQHQHFPTRHVPN